MIVLCLQCEFLVYAGNVMKAKESRQLKPAHVNAPVSKTNPERLELTFQDTHFTNCLNCTTRQLLFHDPYEQYHLK